MEVIPLEIQALAEKLHGAWNNAQRHEQSIQVILFGLRHAKQLSEIGVMPKIVKLSGIPTKFISDLSKGVHLDKYVKFRER
jgi:hypothetical protein